MHARRRERIDAEVAKTWQRYQDAVALALAWMRKTDANQRALAERIGESAVIVSRFLSGNRHYAPCTSRPAAMRALRKIETLCPSMDVIDSSYLETQNVANMTDERLWFTVQTTRMSAIADDAEPGRALVRMREFTVSAIHGPRPERTFLAINELLLLSKILDRAEPAQISDELLTATRARVDKIETVALADLEECDSEDVEDEARARCYAGLARARAGLLLDDRRAVAEGVEGMLLSVTLPSRVESGVWHNLLSFLDYLMEQRYRGVMAWSQRAAELALRHNGESLRHAMRTRLMTRLRDHWKTCARKVWEQFENEEGK